MESVIVDENLPKRRKTCDKKTGKDGSYQKVTINQYMNCRKRRLSPRTQGKKAILSLKTGKGLFANVPMEVLFCIFKFLPLRSMGYLTLTSKDLRDLILLYVYSKTGITRVIPHVGSIPDDADMDSPEYKSSSQKCHEHYRQLGIMLKRSTFLYATKIRLSHVVKILSQLKDSHKKICLELGGDLAFSCYGIFFHAFIAGWEDYEKTRAFEVIKQVSLLSERIDQILSGSYGSSQKYERYVRVLCREIFLNKCCDQDKAFWLAQILKSFPMCVQAKLMYLLYGPVDDENDYIVWNRCVSSNETITRDLSNLSKGFHYMLDDIRGLWSADDIISLFDEITTIANEWDIENIAIFMKYCGDTICCEVLGNKAINNRMSELSYILYYIWQYCSRATLTNTQVRKEQEWFVSLLQHVAKLCTNGKGGETLTKQIFSIWEECMMDSIEDQTNVTDSQNSMHDDERQWFRESLQSMSSLTTILLSRQMKSCLD